MNKIKFSHNYNKMPFHKEDSFEATLLEIFLADRKELSEKFVYYDTRYDEQNYPLPNGKLLILLLWSWSDIGMQLWTTIRRWTPEKEKYYRSKIGEVFECEINEV